MRSSTSCPTTGDLKSRSSTPDVANINTSITIATSNTPATKPRKPPRKSSAYNSPNRLPSESILSDARLNPYNLTITNYPGGSNNINNNYSLVDQGISHSQSQNNYQTVNNPLLLDRVPQSLYLDSRTNPQSNEFMNRVTTANNYDSSDDEQQRDRRKVRSSPSLFCIARPKKRQVSIDCVYSILRHDTLKCTDKFCRWKTL